MCVTQRVWRVRLRKLSLAVSSAHDVGQRMFFLFYLGPLVGMFSGGADG